MPLTNSNRDLDSSKKIYEIIPWAEGIHFEDNAAEAARPHIPIRFSPPDTNKTSLISSAAGMCVADVKSTNHVR